jgi:succinoglycan biosynthesis transport protein ExoP
MLNTLPRCSDVDLTDDSASASETINVDLRSVLRFLRRHIRLICVTALVCGLVGAAYLKLTPKLYTANAKVLIDTRKLDLFRAQAVIEDPTINTAAVESQIQILKSDEVARRVVEHPKLGLLQTEEFGGQQTTARQIVLSVRQLWGGSPVDTPEETMSEDGAPLEEGWLRTTVKALLPGWLNPFPRGPRSKAEITQRAIEKFQERLKVTRIGLSYVIQIEFTSEDPARAALVTNEMATAYINQQLRSKLEMAEGAGKWLEGRIAELRGQATNSDRAVQNFRAEHNIINAGDQLITDQQVQELSKQRILAETNLAEAKARYERIKAVNASQSTDAAVTDALDNAMIVRLQERYLDLVQRQNDLATRYGKGHRTVVALGREISQNRSDMSLELRRLEETYKSEYEIASTRLAQLQEGLDKLLSTSANSLQAQVQLRELQSTSNSYGSLYNSFLERYIQTVQQQSFPVTEAKVITPAAKPLKATGPGGIVILGGTVAFGLLLGCGLAIGRELLDVVLRTPAQLERLSGANFLGVLPITKTAAANGEKKPQDGPFSSIPPRLTYALDAPFSRYAETIRSIRVAVDSCRIREPMHVIGIVSAMPGEGKTTVATNLAFLVAHSADVRILLLDLDLRNPAQTRQLARSRDGLLQVLEGKKSLRDMVCIHAPTGLHFLPTGVHRPISNTSEFLNSVAMQKLLEEARQNYDYVILDLPPLVPLVDAHAVAHMVDGFVLVTEFGKTSTDLLRRALRSATEIRKKLIGAVLNKVDLRQLARLENVGGTYYTSEYYMEGGAAPFASSNVPWVSKAAPNLKTPETI